MLTLSKAIQLGATALRNAARQLAFDANRWTKLKARDGVAYSAFTERTKMLAAAIMLTAHADDLAAAERTALLAESKVELATPDATSEGGSQPALEAHATTGETGSQRDAEPPAPARRAGAPAGPTTQKRCDPKRRHSPGRRTDRQ